MLIARSLALPPGRLPVPMIYSDATALPLFLDGSFGADVIRFPPGGSVPPHTHPGAHILLVLSGRGQLDFDGTPVRLEPLVCYFVPSGRRHAIRADADTELTILAVANSHRPADSTERLDVDSKPTSHGVGPDVVGRT